MAHQAKITYVRVPPRKAKLLADMIRGKDASEARALLKYQPQKSATIISKLVKSAVSNAVSKGDVDPENLFVSQIMVDPGPIMKRYTSRAMGRGARVNKRTSHITVVVAER